MDAIKCKVCGATALAKSLCPTHLALAASQWKAANGLCSEGGCTSKARARKLCVKHYNQWRRTRTDTPRCSAHSCDAAATTNGMCDKHRLRMERTGSTELSRTETCNEPGCTNDHRADGKCNKHYMREYRRQRQLTAVS